MKFKIFSLIPVTWFIVEQLQLLIVLLFYTLLDASITSPDSRIINIKAHKQLSKSEALRLNLPVQLDSDHQFTDNLISAYDY